MSKILNQLLRPQFLSSAPLSSAMIVSSLSAVLALTAAVLPAPAMPAAGSAAMVAPVAGGSEAIENHREKTADGKPYQITSVVVNAAPEEVFSIITDYKKSGLLFKNLTKSELVSRDEDSKTSTVAFSLRGIMNVWSFDYVLSIKETSPNLIEFRRVSGSFKRNEGYWKLLPLDNGKRTEVVYAKYLDAGLMVPPQLVEKQVRDSANSVVANLKKVAENPGVKLASHH